MMFPRARHKFRAQATTKDNIRFDSKLEAREYQKLQLLKQAGEVVGFLRQVPLHFQSGVKHVVDFLVFWADGNCEAVEVKGVETKEFLIKKKLVEDEYPWLDYRIVKK